MDASSALTDTSDFPESAAWSQPDDLFYSKRFPLLLRLRFPPDLHTTDIANSKIKRFPKKMRLNTASPTMMNGPKNEGVVCNSQAPYSTSFKLAIYIPERYTQLTSTCYIFFANTTASINKLFSILWIPAIVCVPDVFW